MESEFNLLHENWILVRTKVEDVREVSLSDIFLHAHEYIEVK